MTFLNISHNKLSEAAGIILGQALGKGEGGKERGKWERGVERSSASVSLISYFRRE